MALQEEKNFEADVKVIPPTLGFLSNFAYWLFVL